MATIIRFPAINSDIEQYMGAAETERLAAAEVRYAQALLNLTKQLQRMHDTLSTTMMELELAKQWVADSRKRPIATQPVEAMYPSEHVVMFDS